VVELVTALIESFLHSPVVIAIGVGIVAAAGAWLQGRVSGARKEREKQAADEAQARTIADQVQNDVGALPADAARQELGKWSRD